MVCTGEMSDAAEVLMAIYEHLTPVAARAGQPQLLNVIFGLPVQVAHNQIFIERCYSLFKLR